MAQGATTAPAQTGGRPPAAASAGQPCPTGIPSRSFDVSAVDVGGGGDGAELAFVPDGIADDVIAGRFRPEPLVLHAAAGECLTVHFTNRRKAGPEGPAPRASFHVAKLDRTPESAGVNVGYDPEGTVAPGESRTYRYHVQSDSIGSAAIADFGGNDTGSRGLYGAVVVAPADAQFADARTGLPRDVGAQVDVRLPGGRSYRDLTLLFADDDAVIGGNTMPYPSAVSGPALVNYRSAPRADDASMFSSRAHGDPATPILTAYPGDPLRIHAVGAPGSEQGHVFSLGGLAWRPDERLPKSAIVTAQGFAAWETIEASPLGGAGGWSRSTGDMFWGDLRRPFTEAGMWGLLRTVSDAKCPVRPLPGRDCIGEGPIGSSPATPTTPGTPPTTGTIRAGTQPLQPVSPTRSGRPRPAPRREAQRPRAAVEHVEGTAAPRGAARRDRARLHPHAACRAATGRVEVGRGRDRAGHPPRGGGGDDLAAAGAHDRAPADRRLRRQRRRRIDRPAPHGPDDVAMSGQRRSSSPSATCVLPFISRKAMASATSATGAT